MEIKLSDISKRYGYNWVIRSCNEQFLSKSTTGIAGHNGSGKSTLINLIGGLIRPSGGKIKYFSPLGKTVDNLYKHISLVAPYTSLVQELSLREQYEYHFAFRHPRKDLDFQGLMDYIELPINPNKRISEFSSGMHQRTQLALALLTDAELLLLDEPTSYLDVQGRTWFMKKLQEIRSLVTIIVASNDAYDFKICDRIIEVCQYSSK